MPNFFFVFTMQRFAAVIMRIREPKTTALIFASGKMVREFRLLRSKLKLTFLFMYLGKTSVVVLVSFCP